jgi:hypothetical protein
LVVAGSSGRIELNKKNSGKTVNNKRRRVFCDNRRKTMNKGGTEREVEGRQIGKESFSLSLTLK